MPESSSDRAVGRVEGKLDLLIDRVDEQREEERQGRSRIYVELEQLRAQAAESKREIADLKGKLAEAAPIISELQRWRERMIGMIMLSSAAFAAVGWAATLAYKWLVAKLGM